jgi:mRNA interferase RelE/StbE
MAKYTIYLSKKAQSALDQLSDHLAAPILLTIEKLSENPRPAGHKKLRGQYGYRVRVGNYRIIYDIIDNKLIIEILAIGNRKDIYR